GNSLCFCSCHTNAVPLRTNIEKSRRRSCQSGPSRQRVIFARAPCPVCSLRGNKPRSERGGRRQMTEMTTIATRLRFPERPVAMKDGSIVLVEIERQTVTRVRPDGSTEVIAHTGGGPNGLAVGPDGAFYVCNNGGFAWRTEMNLMRPAGPASDYTGGRIER